MNMPIPLPPLKEQQKIAEILTTWDSAISKQEELIKEKEKLKKGLMQRLLSGEVRFKEFSDEWKEVRLGEITEIKTGSSNREDSTEEDGKYTFFDRSEDIRTSNRYLFDGEAIIIAGEGQRFIPKYFIGKFDLHQRTYSIMNFQKSIGKYLFYYIWQHNNYFLSQAVGSTVKSLRLPIFEKMKIRLPPLKEQQKIAQVLSTADKEIELLKKELEELKKQKKGLMQRLLTGEVRVKIDERNKNG
jgi:type I restriction enzyme S subunit